MISSRRASTAATSSSPVTASAAPGIRLTSASASYGPQQRLRRHARPERALAADQPVLDDRDLQPVLREPPRRHLAGRPGADHHHIEAPHGPRTLTASTMEEHTTPGTTGFDVVGSWGRLRVEVPEAS